MPFTLSHAAAVLPFRRTRLPWSALVIGSFGPDFEYFLRMHYDSRAWHHFPDLWIYCLPFTLLVYFLFHLFIKWPAIGLLPTAIQQRLHPRHDPYPRSPRDWVMLICALVLGILSHLFCDAFTHRHTWPYWHIAALRNFYPSATRAMQGFEILQSVGTVVGLLILLVFLALWMRKTPPDHPPYSNLTPVTKILILAVIALITCIAARARDLAIVGPNPYPARHSDLVLGFVISSIAIFLWLLLAYGMAMTLAPKARGAHR